MLTYANGFVMKKSRTITQWVEAQQASGRYIFTRKDVEEGLGGSKVAIQTALRRSKQKGQIASPYRGFYVVVPPEYRDRRPTDGLLLLPPRPSPN